PRPRAVVAPVHRSAVLLGQGDDGLLEPLHASGKNRQVFARRHRHLVGRRDQGPRPEARREQVTSGERGPPNSLPVILSAYDFFAVVERLGARLSRAAYALRRAPGRAALESR